jgi:hypothetical protein
MKFEISPASYKLEGEEYRGEMESDFELLELIGENDGLDRHDLQDWLQISKKPFSGQIIFWDDVDYAKEYERILNPYAIYN